MFNTLTNKKIKVKPILRENPFYKKGHDGDFMFTGTHQNICAMKSAQSGQIVDPLKGMKEDDIKIIADKLTKKVEDFSIYREDKNYWKGWGTSTGEYLKGFEVYLDKEVKTLDLSDPIDFLSYRVLITNTDKVAPSWNERYNKGSYKWAIVDEEDEVIEKVKASDKRKKAYMEFGKISESETKLTNFLRIYGVNVPTNSTKDWKKAEVDKIIDNDIESFLTIIEDTDYENKLFILDAMNAKAITKIKNDEYALLSGKSIGSMKEAVKYFKDPKNNPELLLIKARLEGTK